MRNWAFSQYSLGIYVFHLSQPGIHWVEESNQKKYLETPSIDLYTLKEVLYT